MWSHFGDFIIELISYLDLLVELAGCSKVYYSVGRQYSASMLLNNSIDREV